MASQLVRWSGECRGQASELASQVVELGQSGATPSATGGQVGGEGCQVGVEAGHPSGQPTVASIQPGQQVVSKITSFIIPSLIL